MEDESSFLFFERPADTTVARLLKARPGLELFETHHFTYEQWQGGAFKSLKVGEFVLVPPWEKEDSGQEGIRILLDPGVVFGNALHPTTKDCLRALSVANKQRSFRRVLDLGTGTGILALAAAHLGAESALAVDINPLCVKTAAKNVRLNGLSHIIQVVEGPAEDFVHDPADLVVANIHHEVIQRLLDSGGFHQTKFFIISGLMRSQFRDVKKDLEMRHVRILLEWEHDMTWFTLLAEKEIDS